LDEHKPKHLHRNLSDQPNDDNYKLQYVDLNMDSRKKHRHYHDNFDSDNYLDKQWADHSDIHNVDSDDRYYNANVIDHCDRNHNWHDDYHLNRHNYKRRLQSPLANPLHLSAMVKHQVKIHRETIAASASTAKSPLN
jgi:hypothetical protein